MPQLDRAGTHIFYEVTGDADGRPPLLLSHGFGASSAMWRPNVAALAAARQVTTWDMRGHGRSDSPSDPADRLERNGLGAFGDDSGPTAPGHRSASGLALAARGMLAQADSQVIDGLASIRVPTLVLVGGRDEAFLGAADYVAAKMPGAQKVVIPDAGHTCNIDQPDLFNEAVLAFLDSLP
jgi:pimeloyl-ACP methyl ester carboxylesterase